MKKKVCNWLDSNQFGGLHVIDNQIQACPVRGVTLIDNVKLNEVGVDEIQQKRKELFEKINCGNSKICEGCSFLVEKEEEDIDIGKIDTLVLHPYTTCNLHCSYCVISKQNLEAKLYPKDRILAPTIKKLNEWAPERWGGGGLFKENFSLALGGGEPSLINDMKEIAEYMNSQQTNTNLTIITNSSISNRIDYMIDSLSTSPNVSKTHNTSLDSGTRETYKKLKSRDLFDETCNNIKKYASSGIFNEMILKYVMMNDNSNISKKDLRGFVNIVKEVAAINKNKQIVIIDADMRIQKNYVTSYFEKTDEFHYYPISKKQVKAAAFLYNMLKDTAEIRFIGGRINPERSKVGANDVKRILDYANSHEFDNINMLQKIFSVKNRNNHKVLNIFGVKFKFRRKDAV